MYPFKYISNDQYYQKSDPPTYIHIHTQMRTEQITWLRQTLSLVCIVCIFFFLKILKNLLFTERKKEFSFGLVWFSLT